MAVNYFVVSCNFRGIYSFVSYLLSTTLFVLIKNEVKKKTGWIKNFECTLGTIIVGRVKLKITMYVHSIITLW